MIPLGLFILLFPAAYLIFRLFRRQGRTVHLPRAHTLWPWLGSGWTFYHDAIGFFENCQCVLCLVVLRCLPITCNSFRKNLGSVYKVFLAGQDIIIFSDPDNIGPVLRDPYRGLDGHDFQFYVLKCVGGLQDDMPLKLLARLTTTVARMSSNRSIPEYSSSFSQHLLREFGKLACGKEERVSMQMFVERSLHDASSTALWGPSFPLDTFTEFKVIDNYFRLLTLPLPLYLPKARAAQKSLKARIHAWIEGCWKEDIGIPQASSGATDIWRVLRAADCSSSDVVGIFMVFLIGLHSNIGRLATWLLIYLLRDRVAFQRLRREIDHAVDVQFGSIEQLLAANPWSLGSDTFPLLDSALTETMRLTAVAVFVRSAVRDLEVPTKNGSAVSLHAGEILATNGCAMNLSNEYFADAKTFIVDRFIDTGDRKGAPRPVSAFGVGVHAVGSPFVLHMGLH